MKKFRKLDELKQSKILQTTHLTAVREIPTDTDFFKAFIKEKSVDYPLIPKEKGSAFKYLLREYIFKFSLAKDGDTSAFYAGKLVNIILKKTFPHFILIKLF